METNLPNITVRYAIARVGHYHSAESAVVRHNFVGFARWSWEASKLYDALVATNPEENWAILLWNEDSKQWVTDRTYNAPPQFPTDIAPDYDGVPADTGSV